MCWPGCADLRRPGATVVQEIATTVGAGRDGRARHHGRSRRRDRHGDPPRRRLRAAEEGTRKIRDGERVQPRLRTVIEFMFADPEVADAIARYAVRALQPGFWDAK